MKQPKYPLKVSSEGDIYEFTSVGVRGAIPKIILYSPTVNRALYNLAFGNRIETTDANGSIVVSLDDEDISRNGDAEKVIATVVASIYDYTSRYPERRIFFRGSDERRTRGYRLAITRHYEDLLADFHIFGIVETEGDLKLVPFDSRTAFAGYIVYRKSSSAMKQSIVKEADTAYSKKGASRGKADNAAAKPTVSKELDALAGKVVAPKKLEEANKIVAQLKMG